MKKIKFILFIIILLTINWHCIFSKWGAGTLDVFAVYNFNCSKNELYEAIKQLYIKYPDIEPKEKMKPPTSFDSTYTIILKERYADSVYFGMNLLKKNLHFKFELFDKDVEISGLRLSVYHTINQIPNEKYYSGRRNHSKKEERQIVKIFEDEILKKIETIIEEQTNRKIIRSKLYPK